MHICLQFQGFRNSYHLLILKVDFVYLFSFSNCFPGVVVVGVRYRLTVIFNSLRMLQVSKVMLERVELYVSDYPLFKNF